MPVAAGGLLTIATTVATMLATTLGTTLVIIFIVLAALHAAALGHWGRVYGAVIGGGIALSAAWIATLLGGTGATIGTPTIGG